MDYVEVVKSKFIISLVLCVASSFLYAFAESDISDQSKALCLLVAIVFNVLPIIFDSIENAGSIASFFTWLVAGALIWYCFGTCLEFILTIVLTILINYVKYKLNYD